MTVFSDIFEECQVVLDLSTSLSFKQKKAIKETITKNGGVISYIITKKTTHVVLNTADQLGSYKCKQARKLDIPIVSVQFLEECVQQGELLKVKPYLLEKSVTSQQFEKGKISVGKSDDRQKKGKKRSTFNPSHTAACQPEDPRILTWPTLYEVAKWRVLKKEDNRKGDVEYVVIEVHVASELTRDREVYPYRVALHKAWQSQLQNGEEGDEEFRFLKTADEASAVFTHLYDRYHTSHKMRQHHGKLPAGLHMGSHKFLELQSEMISSVDELGQPVATLVEGIWQEALGTVEDILTASITSIKVEQIDKAEGVLLRIRKALEKGSDADYIKELSDDFYTHLPHGKAHKTAITSVKHIAAKQNLCQLLRDVVSVGESTNWSSTSSPVAKFCALHCQIDWLPPHNSNYRRIQKTIAISQGSNVVKIENVFSVNRSIEHAQYKEEVGNEELLFHASPSHNFVGILSRGLLLPRIVVDDFGGKRSDPGMLGNGIYFADAASTSIKYSSPGKVTGSRLMLVSKVALGNCWDTTVKDTELKAPPRGYQSVHGTKATDTCPSEFEDDEYVIYDQCQQCLQYLVEFTLPEDTIQEVTYSTLEQPELAFLQTHTSVNDVKDIPDPLGKVEAGLRGDNDSPVPLKSVHIRAKLVDLAAQVVVLQEYNNENNVPIEAKYVFPLDDMAAVCGFEAFINGKHIIGEVKEKEEAHREYKEAISKGHGAYLMDEEKPDVFTVSVGNLPPKASVLIKITYVAELMTDGELIQFSLPGTVAPWEKDPHLSQVTQSDVDVVKVTQDGTSGSTSVQISIDMPFDIRSIHSPSHDIKMKKTATRAVVELPKNASLGEGLQLQIGLAEIHVPRMWVEKHPTKNSQACMLTFYPEFESSVNDEVEVLFLLDMSNSMKGSAAENAKKVLLLALELMPDFYKFNIIVFGTSYQELFTQARLRTSPNVEEARTFVMSQCPNLGNTDMWRVLHAQHLLPPSEGMRNIFLISDGHISSEDGTLRDVGKHFSHSRVFTLGIGTVANQHLLRGLARVGCGSYEYFDSSTKSKWQRKVETQLEQARQPSLTCVNVEWHQHGDVHARPPTQAPARITSLFSGTRQVVYGFVDNCTQATLKAEIEGEEISTMVSTHELQITTDKIVNTLTARAIIRDWEHGLLDEDRAHQELLKQTKKDWIIELSKEFSIVTKFTSFVAIEERNKDEEKQDGPGIDELVSKENVDSLNYMGWQVAPPEEEAVEVKAVRLLREAELAERISVLQAERHYEQLLALQEHLQDQKLKDIRIDVGKKLATFYKDVKQDNQQAEDIKKAFKVGHTVFIKTLTGKSLPAEVDGSMTVAQLKKQIKEMEGIPLDQQRLVFAGVQLQDQDNLQDYNLQSESTIHLVMRLRGGPIKEAISRQQDEREKAMDLMKQNIEKVLKRNEILETLDQKCDSLEQGSEYFYKLARKHRLSPVDAEHLLPRLKEREELLNKKVDFLERKIEEEVEMARRNKGNKNVALHALKKKRRFESQLMKVDSSLTKIEAASQEIIEDIDPDAELSDEISIMKDLSCMIEDGDEEQEMEDLEISMAISKPVDDFETEDDLLAELDDLTSEESLFDESEILSIEENVCEASAPASISFYPQRFGGAYDAPPATQAMFGGAYDAPPATQAMFGGAYGAPPAPSAMMHAMSAPGREAPPPPSAMPARSAPGRGAPPPPSVITATSAPGRGAPPPPSVITATSAPGRGAPPPPSAMPARSAPVGEAPPPPSAMPVRSAPVGVAPPPPSAITARSAPGRDAPPPPSAMPARSAPGGEAPPPPPPMPVRRGQLCRKMGDNALAQPLPAPIMSCASLIHEISYERPMMKKKRNSRGASSGSVEVADCMEELAMRGSASIMRRKTLEKEEEEDDESDDDDSMGFGLFGDEKYFLEEEKEKKDVKRVTGFMGRKKKKASSVVMDLEVKSSTFYASQESKIHSKKTKAKESIKPEPTNIWKKVFRVDTISLNTLMKVVDLCAGRWDSNIMTQVPELGINKLQLEMILINAGVKSLGNTAYKELLDLTLTLLMVMLLEKYTELAKNKKDQNYLKTQEMLSNIKSHLRNMENRYGSWYTRLELARSQDSLHTAIKEGLPHIDKSD